MLTMAQAFDELAELTAAGKTYTTKQLMDLVEYLSTAGEFNLCPMAAVNR